MSSIGYQCSQKNADSGQYGANVFRHDSMSLKPLWLRMVPCPGGVAAWVWLCRSGEQAAGRDRLHHEDCQHQVRRGPLAIENKIKLSLLFIPPPLHYLFV